MRVLYYGQYRTDRPDQKGDWVRDYWATIKIKKMIKCEPVAGTFQMEMRGRVRTFVERDRKLVLGYIFDLVARKLCSSVDGNFCIVPMPGHDLVNHQNLDGATFQYASAIAGRTGGQATALPLLFWSEPQQKQRGDTGVRNWADRYTPLRVAKRGGERVVLFDDILTSGSTLLAAEKRLREFGYDVVLAVSLLRAVKSGAPILNWLYDDFTADPVIDFKDILETLYWPP